MLALVITWGVIAAILWGLAFYWAARCGEHDGLEGVLIIAAFWPIILAMGVVLSPFMFLSWLGKKHGKKRNV